VQKVTARLLANEGDLMPVSAIPLDGCWPTGTARFEKRNIALEIPQWDASICIQCNKCALVCPHAAIRAKIYEPAELAVAPEGFALVVENGRSTLRPVTVGRAIGRGRVEVLSGLSPGERLARPVR
jgi:pyruvate-ferredoxin/flavodoxin oxidoreductase